MRQSFSKTTRRLVSYLNSSYSLNANHNQKIIRSPKFSIAIRRSIVCWKCGLDRGNTSEVFCEKCDVIQRPHETDNYFKVFGIEEKFNIDHQLLRSKFRKLQSLLHPDKFSNKIDEEQKISADYSSLLNKAYSTLQAPLKRAEHLLKLRGEEISEIGESQAVDDPEFLMDMMSLNEEVEEASNDVAKLRQLDRKNNVELEKIAKEVDNCFINNDIRKAKSRIIKYKYFNSVSNRINGMLRELGDAD